MDHMINTRMDMPKWMPTGKATLCNRDINTCYFRIQRNQGKQDEGELSDIISEENKVNHER